VPRPILVIRPHTEIRWPALQHRKASLPLDDKLSLWRTEFAASRFPAAAAALADAITHLNFGMASDRLLVAELRTHLADVRIKMDNLPSARCAALRGLKGLEMHGGSPPLKARALNCLGILDWYSPSGGPRAALAHFRSAAELLESDPDAPNLLALQIIDNVGLASHSVGLIDEALRSLRKALPLAEKLGDQARLIGLKRRLANVCQDQGLFELSSQLMREIEPDETTTTNDRLAWLNGAAMLAERTGDLATAFSTYQKAVEVFEQLDDSHAKFAAVLSNAGLLYLDFGMADEARRCAKAMSRVIKGGPPLSARLGQKRLQARLATAEGRIQRAERIWALAERLVERAAKDPLKLAEVTLQRAKALWAAGQLDMATGTLRRRLGQLPSSLPDHLIDLAVLLAAYELQSGEFDSAETLLELAFVAEAHRGQVEAEWQLFACLADLAEHHGNSDAAIILGKMAVTTIAHTVSPLSTLRDERRAYLADRYQPYHNLLQRLIDAGRFPEATQVQTMFKSEQAFMFASRDVAADRRLKQVPVRREEALLIRKYKALFCHDVERCCCW